MKLEFEFEGFRIKHAAIHSDIRDVRTTASRTKLVPVSEMENLSRADARNVEQALMEHYGFKHSGIGGLLDNMLNSISPRRKNYEEPVERGRELLRDTGMDI